MSLSFSKTRRFDRVYDFPTEQGRAKNWAASGELKRRRLKTGAQPERAAPQNQ
jgi:hypothetical protein